MPSQPPPLDPIGRDYVTLAFGIGRHVPGYVDAYFGPPEVKEATLAGPAPEPARLLERAQALLVRVAEAEEPEIRIGYLTTQVEAMIATCRRLAGEQMAYRDEVRLLFDVEPERTPEAVFAAAIAELEDLLPGSGPVAERMIAWRRRFEVAPETALTLVDLILPEIRERTRGIVSLPAGEAITVDLVSDKPWSGYNWYLGEGRSRVELNTDLPIHANRLTDLLCHEGYPGHHTERSTKEVELVRRRGALEETLNLVPTPQSLVAEGIAETAVEVLGDDAREAFVEILRVHGIEYDVEHALAVREALRPIRGVGLDAALLLHEDGASVDEVVDFVVRNGATTEERARHNVRFALDPTWRAYAVCYSAGGELARAYHRNDPARFARLLREHVRVPELLAS